MILGCGGNHILCESCFNQHAEAERQVMINNDTPTEYHDFTMNQETRCPACRQDSEVTSIATARNFGRILPGRGMPGFHPGQPGQPGNPIEIN